MSHAFWNIPDEVLFELMDGDFVDRYDEPMDSYAAPRPTHTSMKHLNKCVHCGCPGLEWKETPHGMRLVYTAAPSYDLVRIIGKIHACQE